MTLLRCFILLLFATTTALGQLSHQSKPPSAHEQAESIVQSLYNQVVARHPVGIPGEADMKIFAPYLSKSLLNRIELARACQEDYYRLHKNPDLKPEFEWLEFGLFSGGMENAAPRIFHVLGTESEKNGSIRVYVELIIIYAPPEGPNASVWRIAAIVDRENGQFVVEDVIFLKDYSADRHDFRLSDVLRAGCEGPRWVGYGKHRNDPNVPRHNPIRH
jgi:hypothetical protein